jgi:NADH-quinone oxidoreductase subunit C
MNKALKKQLESGFKGIKVSIPEDTRMIVNVKKEQVLPVLTFFKKKGYDHLALISCVDWINDNQLELVYIMSSYLRENNKYTGKEKLNITLKTRIPRKDPEFVTVMPVFENAEPYEREIHELFGIDFKGHPRLTPLLLEREYETPPFRKDFDTREYVKQIFDTIPFVEEQKK